MFDVEKTLRKKCRDGRNLLVLRTEMCFFLFTEASFMRIMTISELVYM